MNETVFHNESRGSNMGQDDTGTAMPLLVLKGKWQFVSLLHKITVVSEVPDTTSLFETSSFLYSMLNSPVICAFIPLIECRVTFRCVLPV
jgi:hypothetical protein